MLLKPTTVYWLESNMLLVKNQFGIEKIVQQKYEDIFREKN